MRNEGLKTAQGASSGLCVPRTFTAIVACAVITACATTLQGARDPPLTWGPVPTASGCAALSGTYAAQGEPAPGNANAGLYHVLWPTQGSLVALSETAANGVRRSEIVSVRIATDGEGRTTFVGLDSEQQLQPISALAYACIDGALVARAVLGAKRFAESPGFDQASVRLWKSADGSLIAESTIESVSRTASGDLTVRPDARFYFRFASLGIG